MHFLFDDGLGFLNVVVLLITDLERKFTDFFIYTLIYSRQIALQPSWEETFGSMDSRVQPMSHLLPLTLQIKDHPVQNLLLPLDLFANSAIQVYAPLLRLIYCVDHFVFCFFKTFELFLDMCVLGAQLFWVTQTVSNFLLKGHILDLL